MQQPLLDNSTRRARSYTPIRGTHQRVAEEEATRSPVGCSTSPHGIRGVTAFLTGCQLPCAILNATPICILVGDEWSMKMLPYVVGSRHQFFELYLHPRGRCGKQLTQVRIAKLCLKSGIGASIKRAVAPWTPSRVGSVRLCPVYQTGSPPTRLRAMKSVWVNTWR